MILSGSRAIKHWYPDFPREPKDKDLIYSDKRECDFYNGTDFYGGWESCCSQVTPKEKTIIVYS